MLKGELSTPVTLKGDIYRGVGGTRNYEELENLPSINGDTVIGNVILWQPKNFSTDEQNTGIKWVDGKDIYIKTLPFNNMFNGKTIATNINASSVIILHGLAYSNEGYTVNVPYYHTNDYYIRLYYNLNTNEILFETTTTQSAYYNNGFILFAYTKN